MKASDHDLILSFIHAWNVWHTLQACSFPNFQCSILECDKWWLEYLVKAIIYVLMWRNSWHVLLMMRLLRMAIWWPFSVWVALATAVYCSDTLFIMQVLYRIIYWDDNVVMMPKGREQVLSSTWGANKEDTMVRNPLCQSPEFKQFYYFISRFGMESFIFIIAIFSSSNDIYKLICFQNVKKSYWTFSRYRNFW